MIPSFKNPNNSQDFLIISFVSSLYKNYFLEKKTIGYFWLILYSRLIKFSWLLILKIIKPAKPILVINWLNILAIA